ncbi:hypothetical protein PS15p_206409 [Mucor circinelloides]
MLQLTSEEKQYKLPVNAEGSKSFVHTNPAEEWDLETYFDSLFVVVSKKIQKIFCDYQNDLHWISRLEQVLNRIKEYANELKEKKKIETTSSIA